MNYYHKYSFKLQNHTLFQTDNHSSHVYLLLEGRLQGVEEKVADVFYSFTELSAIDIFGDFELFTGDKINQITLTTLEPIRCLVIPAADYFTWIKTDANALFIRAQMIIRLMTAQSKQERQFLFMDSQLRLLYFLYGQAMNKSTLRIHLNLTRNQIASRLGCSLRTTNRIVRQCVNEGYLSLKHGKIQVDKSQFLLIYQRLLSEHIINP
ncbi:Crp/Fnr family transcriptional regulator [Lachnospiraceae bacterium OttesenSCG-928-D06]|nr:Crp/Fnr family transcriptional regulator [Lachnospiraceae bacterium OttesenSCG-928-D06]